MSTEEAGEWRSGNEIELKEAYPEIGEEKERKEEDKWKSMRRGEAVYVDMRMRESSQPKPKRWVWKRMSCSSSFDSHHSYTNTKGQPISECSHTHPFESTPSSLYSLLSRPHQYYPPFSSTTKQMLFNLSTIQITKVEE